MFFMDGSVCAIDGVLRARVVLAPGFFDTLISTDLISTDLNSTGLNSTDLNSTDLNSSVWIFS